MDVDIKLSLVVPVYNEEEAVNVFIDKVTVLLKTRPNIKPEFIFINDGSTDNTLECLLKFNNKGLPIRIIDFSRNFGKEAALSAGLKTARGEVIIPIDVDLQDPPELIFTMLEEWQKGYEVVLAKRIDRHLDSWGKRVSSNCFYRFYNRIADQKIPENVGDFRLMDRSVVNALNQLPESIRFMKGLFAWVGFRTTTIEYIRPERVIGKTKFSGWKLWNFALEGVTSFSTEPLRIWTYVGVFVSTLSFLFAIMVFFRVFIYGIDVPGYASIIVAVTFLGGLQLIGIGIIGEYLGRAYIESKQRPVYLIRNIYEIKE